MKRRAVGRFEIARPRAVCHSFGAFLIAIDNHAVSARHWSAGSRKNSSV